MLSAPYASVCKNCKGKGLLTTKAHLMSSLTLLLYLHDFGQSLAIWSKYHFNKVDNKNNNKPIKPRSQTHCPQQLSFFILPKFGSNKDWSFET